MQALLLRHGETEWNLTGRMQGVADTKLTEDGRQQAIQAASRMPVFNRVVSSRLQRARVTAELIAGRWGGSVVIDDRLRERSWGAWEGLLPAEVDSRWPGWRAEGRKPDGYEFDDSVWRRVHPLLVELNSELSSGSCLLVSHGGLMLAVLRTLGGDELDFKNLEGQWLAVNGDVVSLSHREAYIPDARRLQR